MNDKDIGKRIKEIRIRKGLTLQQVADELGYSDRSAISKIERGERGIGQKKFSEFAKLFNVSISELMGWSENLTSDSARFTANLIKSNNLNEKFMKYVLELADMDNETQNKVFEYMDFIATKKADN